MIGGIIANTGYGIAIYALVLGPVLGLVQVGGQAQLGIILEI